MLVSSGLSGKLEIVIETSVKLKKDKDCNKLTIVSCIGLIVKSLFFFFFVNRVKHAVSGDTEVFQGEGLGKTPDG